MKFYKDLFIALLPIIGLVVLGFVAYISFSLFPSSGKSEYDDILVLMTVWFSLIPLTLVLLFASKRQNKQDQTSESNDL